MPAEKRHGVFLGAFNRPTCQRPEMFFPLVFVVMDHELKTFMPVGLTRFTSPTECHFCALLS
jgi:hypothetical protein